MPSPQPSPQPSADNTARNADDASALSTWRFPHTYALIFGIVIVVGLLTFLIPSGTFDRTEADGREIVVGGSFHEVDKVHLGFLDFFMSVPLGLQEAAQIIFYIFIMGGAFGVIQATGAIEAGIGALVRKLGRNARLLIPILMVVFSILGFTTGMSEESIIFVPIGVSIALALGYDAIVGVALVVLGAASGFIGGMMNPFTVGVAQGIAELPLFSGALFRTVVYLFVLAASITWVMTYASRVKKNPEKSILHGLPGAVAVPADGAAAGPAAGERGAGGARASAAVENGAAASADDRAIDTDLPFTPRRALVLLTLLTGVVINMVGILKAGWFLDEMAGMFVLVAIIAGIIGGLGVNGTFAGMVEGMRGVVYGAIICGFARGILVLLEQAQVLDTMVNAIGSTLQHTPHGLIVIIMFLFQLVLNFFIPSGSGQAAVTMPIMVPLADLLGIDRQMAVLAFQYGDSMSNSIIPTSGALLGALAIAKVSYEKWVKFLWPLFLIWVGIAIAALIVGALTHAGF